MNNNTWYIRGACGRVWRRSQNKWELMSPYYAYVDQITVKRRKIK